MIKMSLECFKSLCHNFQIKRIGLVKKICLTAAFVLIGLMLTAAVSQAFQFSPISRVFSPTGKDRVHEFRVTNEGNDPIAVELKILKRKMDVKGEDVLDENEDDAFVIFPTQTIVMGGNSKKIRVEWLGGPDIDVEQPYRIIAEQVPVDLEKRSANQGAMVQVMLKYVGSVYVRPDGLKSQIVIHGARVETLDGKRVLTLEMENVGARHTLIKDPVLKLGGVELAKEDLAGFSDSNILARTNRTYSIPLPAKLSGIAATTFDSSTLEFTYRESD
jgi:fimbrial chaperone protein